MIGNPLIMLTFAVMKWTVISDNRSNDNRLTTEHGLSILLETGQHHILLDTGASDVFIHNARLLGVNLNEVDYVFISHGHSDHAGGLRYILEGNQRAQVIVSPAAMSGRFYSKRKFLHSITTEWPAVEEERLLTVNDSCETADGIYILSHIPQIHAMPQGNQHLFVEDENGEYVNDDFRHELALYTHGLLFTGCAHSGLENILEACPYPVRTVVGGFHLLDGHETDEALTALAERLKDRYPETQFYTSHCTGDHVYAVMQGVMGNQLQSFCCGSIVEVRGER